MFRTQKWEIGSLARNSLYKILKFLVFWAKPYHEYFKQKGIIVPTQYVIDQQDIQILKNHMSKT